MTTKKKDAATEAAIETKAAVAQNVRSTDDSSEQTLYSLRVSRDAVLAMRQGKGSATELQRQLRKKGGTQIS